MASQITRKATLQAELEAALDWWREAGVDCDFSAEPVDRLAEALHEAEANAPQAVANDSAPSQPLKPAPRPFAPQVASLALGTIGGDRATWPDSLKAFAEWWQNRLKITGAGYAVPPRGGANAELMLLVSQPESGDREHLLSGRHGALLAGFLRAAGLTAEQCYFASALPAHSAMPDWQGLRDAGLGEVLRHHMALAAPRRVLALGRNILPLLGHDMAQGAAQVSLEEGNEMSVPMLAVPGPEELLHSPQRRKRMWHQWLEWTA